MGEAKRRKALDDIYGRGKLPESARQFVRTMQEMVEIQAGTATTEHNARNDHQLFLNGELDGVRGVYSLSIPAKLFDFSEYAFTASLRTLAGSMGATRFGIVMHASDKKNGSSVPNSERGNFIMMLACVDGMWFYNLMNAGENGTISMLKIGEWNKADIEDLAVSNQTNQFMTAIAAILEKSHALQDAAKAMMTLQFLNEHYRAVVSTPVDRQSGSDASIN